jgi:hypothetical protein
MRNKSRTPPVVVGPQVADVFVQHPPMPAVAQDNHRLGLRATDQVFPHLPHDVRKAVGLPVALRHREKECLAGATGLAGDQVDRAGSEQRIRSTLEIAGGDVLDELMVTDLIDSPHDALQHIVSRQFSAYGPDHVGSGTSRSRPSSGTAKCPQVRS